MWMFFFKCKVELDYSYHVNYVNIIELQLIYFYSSPVLSPSLSICFWRTCFLHTGEMRRYTNHFFLQTTRDVQKKVLLHGNYFKKIHLNLFIFIETSLRISLHTKNSETVWSWWGPCSCKSLEAKNSALLMSSCLLQTNTHLQTLPYGITRPLITKPLSRSWIQSALVL